MDLVINTQRLTLRPFQAKDAPALNRIANQAHILKRMPDWASSLGDTQNLIAFFISQYPLARKDSARVAFAVELDGSLIGMVGVGNKQEVDDEMEIAYFISAAYAGRGYTTEAAKAVACWALQHLQLAYLIAIVETDNGPSQRVVEKCGFRLIDTRMILNSGESEAKPFHYYRLYSASLG